MTRRPAISSAPAGPRPGSTSSTPRRSSHHSAGERHATHPDCRAAGRRTRPRSDHQPFPNLGARLVARSGRAQHRGEHAGAGHLRARRRARLPGAALRDGHRHRPPEPAHARLPGGGEVPPGRAAHPTEGRGLPRAGEGQRVRCPGDPHRPWRLPAQLRPLPGGGRGGRRGSRAWHDPHRHARLRDRGPHVPRRARRSCSRHPGRLFPARPMKPARWPLLLALVLASGAHAYPFMIRHGYTQCSTCHTDPSGGTFLNEYGRAQSELLLSSSYGGEQQASAEEGGEPTAGRFLGFVPLPSWFRPGGWVRQGYMWNAVDGSIVDRRTLQMRADLGADLKIGAFRAAAELGYGSPTGTPRQAQITHSTTGPNLVGREFWAGVETFDGEGLLRAGRINVPFGLRNLEHTSFVRTATHTDFNEDQTYGVAFAMSRPT